MYFTLSKLLLAHQSTISVSSSYLRRLQSFITTSLDRILSCDIRSPFETIIKYVACIFHLVSTLLIETDCSFILSG